ncbi:MAG TPA: cache domain-containing protein [Methanotrichaceae archaeon]|nr:cache domain-containing protein [Methanotrichaceae archaeon]
MRLTMQFGTGLALIFLICICCSSAFGQDAISPEAKARIENATNSLAERMISNRTTNLTEIYGLLSDQLGDNPDIFGAAFAFAPVERDGKQILAAAYVYRDGDTIRQKALPEDYNYPESQWYAEPVKQRQPEWSDPYYDDGGAGANVLMTTYSVPLFTRDEAHNLIGVLTGDLLIKKES